jgi:hypothetical protein
MNALSKKIGSGYAAQRAGRSSAEVRRVWLEAWNDAKRLSVEAGVATIEPQSAANSARFSNLWLNRRSASSLRGS